MLTPRRVVLGAAAYLAVAWVAVYAVDVAGVGGLRDRLDAPLWAHVFLEGNLTEMLQWAALGAAALVAAHLAGHVRSTGDRAHAALWTWLSVLFVVMLTEDAGNVRHTLREYGEAAVGVPGFATNSAALGAVAALALFVLWRHRTAVMAGRPGRGYLLAAYALYGLGGALSATGPLWYEQAGRWLDTALFGGRLPVYDLVDIAHHYLVMDLMVEETIELLGAAVFLAAVLAYRQRGAMAPRAEPLPAGEAAGPGRA